MNKERRKAIRAIADMLENIQLPNVNFEDVKSEVEALKDEEQEYYDNMPESLQGGDNGQRAEEAVGYLQEAEDALDELVQAWEKLSEAVEHLRNAEGV